MAYASYLGKTVWPIHLAVLLSASGEFDPLMGGAGGGSRFGVLSVLIIRQALSYPYLAVGWLWFIGTLVPVIGIFQVGSQAMADRYTYIPLIGLFIMVAWGMADLLARWRCPKFLLPLVAGDDDCGLRDLRLVPGPPLARCGIAFRAYPQRHRKQRSWHTAPSVKPYIFGGRWIKL